MANLIHVYQGSVTSGGTDGTQVSEGTETAPIIVGPLNATNNEESSAIKLAIRCDAGYNSSGNAVITPTGTTADKWALAPDNAGVAGSFGTYGSALTISSVIGTTNTLFWVKAKASNTETPANDTSVDLVVNATINAVP
ncbi:hypothetical protein [Clostridium sp. AWRP]|uniref:hypothetical protein n=1 Tax=Clostridium sp. AWRP TaxID=2212991 RepID=UPI000FD73B48|nr:hypothetical protein [Clostridium sp. AWRP]AZV56080.1 hypothetical protein DMR38_05410 [Clostridium sp. AWRP]